MTFASTIALSLFAAFAPQANAAESCGGVSSTGACYYDTACHGYGDCCDDYYTVCPLNPSDLEAALQGTSLADVDFSDIDFSVVDLSSNPTVDTCDGAVDPASYCGEGTALIDGLCQASPDACPELTEWHPTLNTCQSTVNGVCSVETAFRWNDGEIVWYYFFGDTDPVSESGESVSGTRGGHCLDHDGGDCSADVRAACDTIRAYDQQGLTNGVAGEDLCTTVSPSGGFSFVPGKDYSDFFDACGTIFDAGMRVEQRHGI